MGSGTSNVSVSKRKRTFVTAVVALMALTASPVQPQPVPDVEEKEGEPLESALIETTGVTLMLLDVVVTDKQGRFVRGLTRDDFDVVLNGRSWPIYSVDDLCGCPEGPHLADTPPSPETTTRPPDRRASDPGAPASPAPEAERISYVLYLDFSQLQGDGRDNALAEARRWVLDVKRPTDSVMVAAFATVAGLRDLTGFTTDGDALLAALDEAATNPDFMDSFPNGHRFRIQQCITCCDNCTLPIPCRDCCPDCKINATEEYYHGRNALRALQRLLVRLEEIPGRKMLFMFHQNNVIYPRALYPMLLELDVGDHVVELDRTAAEATTSRTAVYTAYAGNEPNLFGPLGSNAVNFGANLANFTGGDYNRTIATLDEMTGAAGRDCECLYRIGFEPPDPEKGKVYRAKVYAAGLGIKYSYRVQNLTPMDRWWREATNVIVARDSTDLPIAAALVPIAPDDKGWGAAIQVVVDVSALVLLPGGGDESRGQWEVGALLERNGDKHWEMLGVSSVTRSAGQETTDLVVHERKMSFLKPGTYTLGAFVHDKVGDVFGGTEIEIVLPKLDDPVVIGPVLMRLDRTWVRTGLPLFDKKERKATPTRTRSVSRGPIPASARAIDAGQRIEAWTWICPSDSQVQGKAVRYVSYQGEPIFSFDPVEQKADGNCFQVRDVIETAELETGRYAVHVRWRETTMEEPVVSETSFEIPGRPTAETASVAPGR